MAEISLLLDIQSRTVGTASSQLRDMGAQAVATGKQVDSATDQINKGLSGVGITLGTLVKGFATWKALNFADDILKLGARYETLSVVMDVVGKNAGKSRAEMNQFQRDLQSTGISAIGSREALNQMAQAQLDLAKSSKLARLAQDAAVVGNTNSTEAFLTLVHAIQTGNQISLRSLGIMANFREAYAAGGKEATQAMKVQERFDAVMKSGTAIQGAYTAAMQTAGKQLQSTVRYMEDAKVAASEAFQPAYTELVFGYANALKFLGHNAAEVVDVVKLLAVGVAVKLGSSLLGWISQSGLMKSATEALTLATTQGTAVLTQESLARRANALAIREEFAATEILNKAKLETLVATQAQLGQVAFGAGAATRNIHDPRPDAFGDPKVLLASNLVQQRALRAEMAAGSIEMARYAKVAQVAVIGVGELSMAAKLAAGATRLLSGAVAFLGGPFGAAIAVAGGAWLLYSHYAQMATDANTKLLDSITNMPLKLLNVSEASIKAQIRVLDAQSVAEANRKKTSFGDLQQSRNVQQDLADRKAVLELELKQTDAARQSAQAAKDKKTANDAAVLTAEELKKQEAERKKIQTELSDSSVKLRVATGALTKEQGDLIQEQFKWKDAMDEAKIPLKEQDILIQLLTRSHKALTKAEKEHDLAQERMQGITEGWDKMTQSAGAVRREIEDINTEAAKSVLMAGVYNKGAISAHALAKALQDVTNEQEVQAALRKAEREAQDNPTSIYADKFAGPGAIAALEAGIRAKQRSARIEQEAQAKSDQRIKDSEADRQTKIDEQKRAWENMQRSVQEGFTTIFDSVLKNGIRTVKDLTGVVRQLFSQLASSIVSAQLVPRLLDGVLGKLKTTTHADGTTTTDRVGGLLGNGGSARDMRGNLRPGYRALGIGGAALGGALTGYETGSPLTGAATGAAAGAVAGPAGIAVGALAGYIGGLFGMAKAAQKATEALHAARAAWETALNDFVKKLYPQTELQKQMDALAKDVATLVRGELDTTRYRLPENVSDASLNDPAYIRELAQQIRANSSTGYTDHSGFRFHGTSADADKLDKLAKALEDNTAAIKQRQADEIRLLQEGYGSRTQRATGNSTGADMSDFLSQQAAELREFQDKYSDAANFDEVLKQLTDIQRQELSNFTARQQQEAAQRDADLSVRKLRAAGSSREADAAERAAKYQKEYNDDVVQFGKDYADSVKQVQEAEEKRTQEELARRDQEATEDYAVRTLRAQGRNEEADALAEHEAQQREYEQAVRDGLSESAKAALTLAQAAEAAASAADKALQKQQALEDLAIRDLRATGHGDEADRRAFDDAQKAELEQAKKDHKDQDYIDSLTKTLADELAQYIKDHAPASASDQLGGTGNTGNATAVGNLQGLSVSEGDSIIGLLYSINTHLAGIKALLKMGTGTNVGGVSTPPPAPVFGSVMAGERALAGMVDRGSGQIADGINLAQGMLRVG